MKLTNDKTYCTSKRKKKEKSPPFWTPKSRALTGQRVREEAFPGRQKSDVMLD